MRTRLAVCKTSADKNPATVAAILCGLQRLTFQISRDLCEVPAIRAGFGNFFWVGNFFSSGN